MFRITYIRLGEPKYYGQNPVITVLVAADNASKAEQLVILSEQGRWKLEIRSNCKCINEIYRDSLKFPVFAI